MLKFLTGRAGAGKTAAVIGEIRDRVSRGLGGSILLVPEQYSHEAERELCRACGDRLSLYAEVLSFSGLQRRMAAELGGDAVDWLDKGGRMLCMALALQGIGPRLRVYGAAQRRTELQTMLLRAVDELKSACISAEILRTAAAGCDDGLGDKLSDLALLLEAYDSVAANGRADPADRLSILARQIGESSLGSEHHVYVDGFIDFTRQEQEVLFAMLRRGVNLTVCLTLDSFDSDNEIFALSRHAAWTLADYARERGQPVEISALDGGRDDALAFFADHMFSYSAAHFQTPVPIRLLRAESMAAECEYAAALCLELVRDKGCRWRDIAVAARGFEDYRGTLESVFHLYGVPLFTAAKSDLLAKPLPAMIACVYEIVRTNWALDDVISYLRTGLAGLDERECDELERYLFKWQIQGSAWERPGPWRQHPDGYGAKYTPESEDRLACINTLRRRAAGPLKTFARKAKDASTASEQAAALAGLFRELRLPETLASRAEELQRLGREQNAAEYRQLWDLIVAALEQCDRILGAIPMDCETFGKLFLTMLSQYDIGTIPVSLDRVSAGDFDRNRRRNIRHLIILGASDQRLPRAEDGGGVFSLDERQRLLEIGIDLGAGGDNELWREFSLIYYTLTLPSESLSMLCPLEDGNGNALRPASVFRRAGDLFGIRPETADLTDARMSACGPSLALAAQAIQGGGTREQAAREYFTAVDPERMTALEASAAQTRGSLSPASVERLYGRKLRLSASRVEKFSSCRFSYFCRYGLRAEPYEPAGFQPPEMGTFMHFVLENTAREVRGAGGFKAVDNAKLREITDRWVQQYIDTELNGFQEKSSRFVYLFHRLRDSVYRVVEDMAEELRRSDFEPLEFELDFSKAEDIRPMALDGESGSLTLTGVVDRVDGWVHEGKLYLRVVDYKTGHREFSLSDVWYGLNLQMLMYLFTLSDGAQTRYGAETAAAGVMYIPARNPMLSLDTNQEDGEILEARSKELRRSGLVLDRDFVRKAWENGDEQRYIPVRVSNGKASPDALASPKRLELLSRHIRRELTEMSLQLRQGSIAADPFYRSARENACAHCDYASVCHFADGVNGEKSRYLAKLKPEEVWKRIEEVESNG